MIPTMKAEGSMNVNNGQLVDQNGHLQTEFQSVSRVVRLGDEAAG